MFLCNILSKKTLVTVPMLLYVTNIVGPCSMVDIFITSMIMTNLHLLFFVVVVVVLIILHFRGSKERNQFEKCLTPC